MVEGRCRGLAAVKAERGWTWRWLARQAGYSEAYVYMVRTGRRSASAAFRAAVARVLGLPEDVLFYSAEYVD